MSAYDDLADAAHFGGELGQALVDPLTRQVGEFPGQGQHQTPVVGQLQADFRQHAGHGGGQDIGQAENVAEQVGAGMSVVVDQAGQAVLGLLAVIAVEDGEGQEHPARMIDADKGRLRDHAERTLGAIVGMGPPADIGEEAGGIAQPPLVFAFLETARPEQLVGPVAEFEFMLGRARVAAGEIPA